MMGSVWCVSVIRCQDTVILTNLDLVLVMMLIAVLPHRNSLHRG